MPGPASVPSPPPGRRFVELTAPVSPDLQARYIAHGWWGAPQHVGAIESWAQRAPDRVAIVDPLGRFTYAELDGSVRRALAWLEDRDVTPGEPVLAVLPNWFESVALYHAVLRAGAVAVPLSAHARAAELRHVAAATGARILVVPPSHHDLAEAATGRSASGCVGLLTPSADAYSVTHLRGRRESSARPATRDVAVVLFTSGSTADPKGVVHTHDSLAVANRNLTTWLGLGDDDVHYVPGPIAHVGGLMHALHMGLENGARVVLDDVWDPDRAAERITTEQATFVGGAPVFPQGIARAFAHRGRSSLRVICTGGAWIPKDLGREVRELLGARLVRSYGSTECPFAAGSLPTDGPEQCDGDDGALTTGTEARVDPSGTEGELLVRGAALFQGYVDPRQNTSALRDDGWFATGDVVELRGDRVRVVGRMKAVAIRNGENISLDEVERALDRWSGAVELAAFAVPDPKTGERVAVAVVPGDHPSYDGMLEHLDQRAMARQKYPEQIVIWERLPLTASGKVDRRALAAGAGDRPTELAPRLRASTAR